LKILQQNQKDYDRMVRQTPELQRLGYHFSDSTVTAGLFDSFLSILLFPALDQLLENHKPDLILTTFNMYVASIHTTLSLRNISIPYFVVITDLTHVHRTWLHPGADLICVPTPEVYQDALARGIPSQNLFLSGIPVHPQFTFEKRSPQEIRRDFGWDQELTTALVVGSRRIKNLEKILRALNHTGWPIQWILVAGKDETLHQWFRDQEWHNPAFIYPYVDDISPFLHAADFIITKAGGLIVSEALASGLPLFIVDVTPGQEEGNADYVLRNGAGELATTPLAAVETFSHWMINDREKMKRHAHHARLLGRPEAAFDIARTSLEFLSSSPGKKRKNRWALSPIFKQVMKEIKYEDTSEESGKI
jgi:1,2-diacylglycerol 3-beta-galactosyltransferase